MRSGDVLEVRRTPLLHAHALRDFPLDIDVPDRSHRLGLFDADFSIFGPHMERMADGSYFLYAHFAGNFRGNHPPTAEISRGRVDLPAKSQCIIALTSGDEDGASPPDRGRGRVNPTTCVVLANYPDDKHGDPYKALDLLKNRGLSHYVGKNKKECDIYSRCTISTQVSRNSGGPMGG